MISYEEPSSGYGGDSPVPQSPTLNYFKSLTKRKLYHSRLDLDDIRRALFLHLKRERPLSKEQLQQYSTKIDTYNPPNAKKKWETMKIKALLSFILKKRARFITDLVKGNTVIYEKIDSDEDMSFLKVDDENATQTKNQNTGDLSLNVLLTNQNFVSQSTVLYEPINNMKCEIKDDDATNTYDFSADMFGTCSETKAILSFSQENCKMFKELTENKSITQNNSKDYFRSVDSELFKTPHPITIVKTCEESQFSSLPSTQDANMIITENIAYEENFNYQTNIFDQCYSLEELTKELESENLEETQIFNDFINSLLKLEIHEDEAKVCIKQKDEMEQKPFVLVENDEKNFQIIKEAQFKYKHLCEGKGFDF